MKKVTPQARYDAAHTVSFSLKLNRGTDKDIIAVLETQPNKQGFIKAAVRDYLRRRRDVAAKQL